MGGGNQMGKTFIKSAVFLIACSAAGSSAAILITTWLVIGTGDIESAWRDSTFTIDPSALFGAAFGLSLGVALILRR